MSDKQVPEIGSGYRGWTTRWFHRGGKKFRRFMSRFDGKPITYLEIGVFEGASAEWMCKNVLTHQDSIGHGVDPYLAWQRFDQDFMAQIKQRAVELLSQYPNFSLHFETSSSFLRSGKLQDGSVDVVYIDGSHDAENTLRDAVMSWELLKVGGVMAFDDCHRKHLGKNDSGTVPYAVDSLRLCYSDHIETVLDAIQTVVKKTG